MQENRAFSPVRVSRQFVEAKCDYFRDIHLWPREATVRPAAWLSNFTESEMDHAVHLLNAFLYYSADLTAEMFRSAFHTLSSKLIPPNVSYNEAKDSWSSIRSSMIVTRVSGEIPNDSDSGYMFARMARQHLGLDQHQIKSNSETIDYILSNGPTPVVFVDDFSGSGNQFVRTWNRRIETESGEIFSFKQLSQNSKGIYCYCPVFVADLGKKAITDDCPQVILSPAHYLPEQYSALVKNSVVWPDYLKPTALEFIECASRRAGIDIASWKGYMDQGLTLAFEHGVPDATLPLYYHEENGWKYLIRKT